MAKTNEVVELEEKVVELEEKVMPAVKAGEGMTEWQKEDGSTLTLNNCDATIEHAVSLGWKPV